MSENRSGLRPLQIIHALSAAIVLITYFLPWVSWDGTPVKGMDMASGNFFRISDQKFGVANPFPEIGFLFYVFWLLPLLAAISAVLPFVNKKTIPFSFFAGALSLSLITVYYLFSKTLIDLGAGNNVMSMLKPFFWVQVIAAVILIITAYDVKKPVWKIFWLLMGPVLAFSSFKLGEKYVMEQTHSKTKTVTTDFKISAESLIREFLVNDTAANKKYVEKILEVDGKVSAIDILPDSSGTLKFEDSTGSYAIFSFDKEEMDDLKTVTSGSAIVVKAVCSGSIYSEILGTTSISFKRSTIINK